jgi:hypothetical protein
MAGEPPIPCRLKDERLAAGIATAEKHAVLAGCHALVEAESPSRSRRTAGRLWSDR